MEHEENQPKQLAAAGLLTIAVTFGFVRMVTDCSYSSSAVH